MKIIVALFVVILSLTSCGVRLPLNPSPSGTPTAPVSSDPEILTLSVREGAGKSYIVDQFGRAVYIYGSDGDSEISTCPEYLCPHSYKPVLAPDNLKVSPPLDNNQVGVGGKGQVIYNGHLLYFKVSAEPGLSGEWFMLDSTGNPI